MGRKKKVGLGQWVLTVIMGLYAFVCLAPVVLIIIVSFSSDESVKNKGFSFVPEFLSFPDFAT